MSDNDSLTSEFVIPADFSTSPLVQKDIDS